MSIYFDEQQQSFILQGKASTYVLGILHNKYLAHYYWGGKIENPVVDQIYHKTERPCTHATFIEEEPLFSLDTMPAEYAFYGTSDMRMPACQIEQENGSRITEFVYDSYQIVPGTPHLDGLPCVYTESDSEAETLIITLKDELLDASLELYYSVFKDYDVVLRSAKIINQGTQNLKILRAFSMCMDFPEEDFELITLAGSWARERRIIRRPVVRGVQSAESRRGASSHAYNPFLALVHGDTNEKQGEAYGFSLVYSGNFYGAVELNQYDTPRVVMGLNSFDFRWKLAPGESFSTPQAVLTYSNKGLNGMSQTYHKLYQNRLARGKFKLAERPILINNWEATYFDFDENKIIAIAKEASQLGIEMLVLDDGWFGKRDIDDCSLGDWFEDKRKLPHGLKYLAEEVNKTGMKFGLWFEPEAISPDSDLYRAHPDWCLHVPDRRRTEARAQLILDYSRQDVRDYIVKSVSDVLNSANIEYVKWDMNRNMTEIGSALLDSDRQMETAHRYMLGLYEVLETITTAFPNVLFESCAGGGGRFDPGMMHYMPQNWTSDDTDGLERLKIQYGTSLVYPTSLMTNHVSAVPNHQTGRITSLDFRGKVAMSGNFGYELDVTTMSDEEKEIVKEQITVYKSIRRLVQYGTFYRLLSPFQGESTGWITVSEDKQEAVAFYYQRLTTANPPMGKMRLDGLNPELTYVVNDEYEVSGSQLMNYGINIDNQVLGRDFSSMMIHLKAK